MIGIVTGGVGVELGAAGYGAKEFGGLLWRGAKTYHSTFGVNGGYLSMGMELTNQTTTQIVQNGGVSLYDYDLLGLGTSGFLRGSTPLKYQMLQGASGGVLTCTLKDGFQSPILQKPNGYGIATMLNGTLSPLMGRVPIVQGKSGEILNEVITGGIQGALDKAVEEEGK